MLEVTWTALSQCIKENDTSDDLCSLTIKKIYYE
jgi:hypothetical protein